MPEIEAKILEINSEQLKARLLELGAQLSFSDEMEAVFYDHPADPLLARGATLRLRREGKNAVLTYKTKVANEDSALKVLDEKEVEISDFQEMHRMLLGLGYQETHRTHKHRLQYELPGAHVVIDGYRGDWARIPTFCEIEAESAERLYEVADLLGYRREQLSNWNTFDLMEHYQAK